MYTYANVYGRDITRLKLAESQLIAANQTLERQNRELEEKNAALMRANRLKDEFLANTSHELRTPLNGIVGVAESLLDGASRKLSPLTRDNLEVIVSSGRRLARLVNEILDFSQLQHRGLDLSLRAIDLRTAVEVALVLFQPLARKKGLELRNEVGEDLPLLLADEDRLQQILHNLLGNAVKFTAGGEVVVSVEEVLREGVAFLAVSVRDTGIGIAPDAGAHIFEAFMQGDGAVAREYGGTGLGLSVTRSLVGLHGGEIGFTSEQGRGACFTFTLPIATAAQLEEFGNATRAEAQAVQRLGEASGETTQEHDPQEDEPQGESDQASAIPGVGLVNVLFVDDDPTNLRVLNNHLAPRGYTVHQAESGQQALQMLKGGYVPISSCSM